MRCLIGAAAVVVVAWVAVLVVGVGRFGPRDPIESVEAQFGGFGDAPPAQRALHWTVGRKAVSITRIAKTDLPPQPSGLAVLPDGTLAVTSRGAQSLLLVDPRTLSVAAEIPVGGAASGLAVSGGGTFAWITLEDRDRVTAVDLASRKVTAEVGVGKRPFGPVAPRSGGVVLVPSSRSGDLAVIDTRNAELIGAIALGAQPVAVVAHPTGTVAWVAVTRPPALRRVDWSRRVVEGSLSLAGPPAGLTATADGEILFAPVSRQRALIIADRPSGQPPTTCDLPGPAGEQTAIGPNGRDLFVCLRDGARVAVVDAVNHTARLVGALDEPASGLAFSDDARKLYAIHGESGTLCVYEIGYE